MKSEMVSVGTVCRSVSSTYARTDSTVVLINTSDVFEGKILNHKCVTNENLKGQFKKTFCPNDILYSEIRPANKRYAFVKEENVHNYIASTKLMVIRADERKVLPSYLYAYLTMPSVLAELQRQAESRSGTFPQITFAEVAALLMPLPSLPTQRKIAAILSSLDDKIENNNAICRNLEEQLKSLFQQQFAEFLGAGTEESVCSLDSLCEKVTKGTTPTTLGYPFVGEGINFVKAESITDEHSFEQGKFAKIEEDTHAVLSRSQLREGDILFTIAGTLGRYALVDKSILPANTNQAVAIIRVNRKVIESEYLYSFFLGGWHQEYYKKRVQQAVQANLSLSTIKSLPIAVLPDSDMRRYMSQILPVISKIKQCQLGNRKLSSLRDTLLPKLMSGEIDVDKVSI